MANIFKGVAVKSLSSVEIDHWQSNQHEFHGVTALKQIFGYQRQYFRGEFYYVENSGNILKDTNVGELTWYDAREYSVDRSEYRFYYTDNIAVNKAKVGDILVVALCDDGTIKIIIIEQGTQFIDVLKHALGLNAIDEKYHFVENLNLVEGISGLFR
ncbi:hypothetical protein [Anaerocolumna sp. MB42-C2]|uniref:hypothetical protein n=1 Tax=Anaerocolumna sp. MB42-C2 TaxID=3070997 RepID=UPI0027E04DD6|nr:hypothetical protein [Anaerocolumna sp. MB42-C2]WMJ86727.1 hypothetical protein RBU59_22205 [Anaerocolumna sp. MB42-C2]